MPHRILVVEDQLLIALHIEDAVLALGHEIAGIAANTADALDAGEDADIALVDVHLQDGATGPDIGRLLAARGVTVIFMTANPEAIASGIPGALGVISKPLFDLELIGSIQFASEVRDGRTATPPERMRCFDRKISALH